jgi:uncharacterized membrane protein
MSRLGARLVQDEEETQAQNKIIFALLLLLAIYPAMFFFLWALFWLTPMGAVVALAMSYGFIVYHVKIVDDNYEQCVPVLAIESQLLKVCLVRSGLLLYGASCWVFGLLNDGICPSRHWRHTPHRISHP